MAKSSIVLRLEPEVIDYYTKIAKEKRVSRSKLIADTLFICRDPNVLLEMERRYYKIRYKALELAKAKIEEM